MAGCMPSVTPDKLGTPDGVDTAVELDSGEAPPSQTMAVISTLADDYSVGAVATVDLVSLALLDTQAPTSGDAVVRAAGEEIVVLNRLNTDTLLLYTPGQWAAPTLELALPDLSNPQDAKWCGDKLWVTMHSADHLPAYDRSGTRVAQADLSRWAGSDGSAEALGLHVYEGGLYVALEQFAQDDGWESEGGAVVRVDCETSEVSLVADAAPSPAISPGPEAGSLLVRTGIYGQLDGKVELLDLATGQRQTLLRESDVGADITGAEIHGESLVYLSADADWTYRVHCRDLASGEETVGLSTDGFLSDLKIDDRGRAWVAARSGWGEGAGAPGLYLLDAQTCSSILGDGQRIRTTLSPYNLSLL
jgi:hypothetical protein